MEHDMVIIDMPLDGRNTPLNIYNNVLPSSVAPSPLGIISLPPSSPQSSVISYFSVLSQPPLGMNSVNTSTIYHDSISPQITSPSTESEDNNLGNSDSKSETSEIEMHDNIINAKESVNEQDNEQDNETTSNLTDNVIIKDSQIINETNTTVIDMDNISVENDKNSNDVEMYNINKHNLTVNTDCNSEDSERNKIIKYSLTPKDIKIIAIVVTVVVILIIIICVAATH